MRIEKNEWIAQSFVAFSVLNQKENNNGNLGLCQHLKIVCPDFFPTVQNMFDLFLQKIML